MPRPQRVGGAAPRAVDALGPNPCVASGVRCALTARARPLRRAYSARPRNLRPVP